MLAHWVLTWASTGAKWLARLMGSFFLACFDWRRPSKKHWGRKASSSRWCLQTMVSKHQWLGKAILLPNVKGNCQLGEWIRGKWSYFINPTLDWGSELSGLGTLDLSYFDSRWLPTAWINSSIISIQSIHFKQTNQIHPICLLQIWFELNKPTSTSHPAIHPDGINQSSYKEVQGLREPSQILWLGFTKPIPDLSWKPTHFEVRKNWTSFRKNGEIWHNLTIA